MWGTLGRGKKESRPHCSPRSHFLSPAFPLPSFFFHWCLLTGASAEERGSLYLLTRQLKFKKLIYLLLCIVITSDLEPCMSVLQKVILPNLVASHIAKGEKDLLCKSEFNAEYKGCDGLRCQCIYQTQLDSIFVRLP